MPISARIIVSFLLIFILSSNINGQGSIFFGQNQALTPEWFDITAPPFNADRTGIKDSLGAVEAAMTAACAVLPSGATVWFPPGKYTFSNIIPSTASWCNGLTLMGDAVRPTELDFPTGSGYAITEKSGTTLSNGIRNLTIENMLIVIGGGSSGSNNSLGGIFIGNYAFTHEYRNLYIIGPTTSTAIGIGDGGDSYISTIGLENVRVDNFGGVNGEGFQFIATNTGDLLYCHFCYSVNAYIGIEVGFFWTAKLDQSDVDGSTHYGFYLHPANGNTIIGDGLSGEKNTGPLYLIYGNGTGIQGGTVILTAPKSSGELGATSSISPFEIKLFAGDIAIIYPGTINTGGSSYSFDILSGTPHSITIMGCDYNLDKGFSPTAKSYLTQKQSNICSN